MIHYVIITDFYGQLQQWRHHGEFSLAKCSVRYLLTNNVTVTAVRVSLSPPLAREDKLARGAAVCVDAGAGIILTQETDTTLFII